jgi:YHS domain-containing protein
MKKLLYIITTILTVVAVLSAAGCAEKVQTTGNELQGTSEHVTPVATPTATTMTIDSEEMKNVDSNSSKVVDVVCKMKVDKNVTDTSMYQGKMYYFCSPYCKKKFDENPEKYLNSQNNT